MLKQIEKYIVNINKLNIFIFFLNRFPELLLIFFYILNVSHFLMFFHIFNIL